MGVIGGTVALISYGYWIREEGWTGREGLRACRFDLALSYAVIGQNNRPTRKKIFLWPASP